MPSKNRIKQYAEDGHYHAYNRGVGKNLIFKESQDYLVFISYLKELLSPPVPPTEEEVRLMKYSYIKKNYHGEIELLAFCLMPNHFHLLLKQNQPRSIESFMRSLGIRYSGYFNKHHERVGHLFQDTYKGVLIQNDEYLWWLSRYIHRNPAEFGGQDPLSSYPYSSYASYIGMSHPAWICPEMILGNFKDYRSFVEDEPKDIPEFIEDFYLE